MNIPNHIEDFNAFDIDSTVDLMEMINWEALEYDERTEVLDYFTERIYREFGPDGEVKPIGYDIDDAQWIVWCAYERALEKGKIRLGLF